MHAFSRSSLLLILAALSLLGCESMPAPSGLGSVLCPSVMISQMVFNSTGAPSIEIYNFQRIAHGDSSSDKLLSIGTGVYVSVWVSSSSSLDAFNVSAPSTAEASLGGQVLQPQSALVVSASNFSAALPTQSGSDFWFVALVWHNETSASARVCDVALIAPPAIGSSSCHERNESVTYVSAVQHNGPVSDIDNDAWDTCTLDNHADGLHHIEHDNTTFVNTTVSICSFNIQVFGVSKAGKRVVMNVLKKILVQFDVVVIQEIRDASDTAFWELVDLVNAWGAPSGVHFSAVKSERLGRTTSKEEYGYLLRDGVATNLTSYQYNDTVLDKYEREPFGVLVKIYNEFEFMFLNSHIKPDDAVAELDYFVNVYDDMRDKIGTHSMLLGGDLNADCSYVGVNDYAKIRLYNRTNQFDWYIDNDDDTTLAASDCAYDRFVAAGDELRGRIVKNSTHVVRFDNTYDLNETTAKKVSDHYPIAMQLQFLGPSNYSIPVVPASSPAATGTPSVSSSPSTSPSVSTTSSSSATLSSSISPEDFDISAATRAIVATITMYTISFAVCIFY